MNAELISALNQLEYERGISKDVLLEAIEAALTAAYKRNAGSSQEVRVQIDRQTGATQVYSLRRVVETVEDPAQQISLEEAQKKNRKYQVGDMYESCVTPKEFGRIAAQTAKQIMVQRIREAERGMIYDEFSQKENEVVNAVVQRVERNNVFVQMGKTEGFLPPSERMEGERYYPNDRIKVYVVEVRKTNRGPQIIVSRSHPGLVKRLFEIEVPEIQSGVVQIWGISREAGQRTKMAVFSKEAEVDPIGACVGQKGVRVERVVEELRGEKIDIIKWSPDAIEFIANALSPARVVMVQLLENERIAKVIVPDNQLSLAIGKEGQNARLAAKLTGWKIDIKSQTQSMDMIDEISDEDERNDTEASGLDEIDGMEGSDF
jgi:N utilization substance protein A